MRISTEWNDHQELFDIVTEALDQAVGEIGNELEGFNVYASHEDDGYGGRGQINLFLGDKKFSLQLSEEK